MKSLIFVLQKKDVDNRDHLSLFVAEAAGCLSNILSSY